MVEGGRSLVSGAGERGGVLVRGWLLSSVVDAAGVFLDDLSQVTGEGSQGGDHIGRRFQRVNGAPSASRLEHLITYDLKFAWGQDRLMSQ